MWKKSKQIFVIIILIIFVIIQFPYVKSSGLSLVIQENCHQVSAANFASAGVTLSSNVAAGDTILVVVDISGTANTVINGVNATDNLNSGQYTKLINTTDFANSLRVSIFEMTNTASGTLTVTVKMENTPNHTQNIMTCAYETLPITSTGVHHSEGGSSSISTGTSGALTVSGFVLNAGTGSAISFTGTNFDSSGITVNNNGIGRGSGTWSWNSGVTFSEEADASFNSGAITITFAQSGITGNLGLGILAINSTIYSVAQLPVSFTYPTSSNNSDTITYGFFSSVNNQPLSSVGGCGQSSANGIIIPSTSGTCTITATYAGAVDNTSSVITAISNQIFRIFAYLIPSIVVLFFFLWIGVKFGLHGDALVFLAMIGIGVLSVLGSLLSGQFVPIWVGGISVIFMMIGFIYFKSHR